MKRVHEICQEVLEGKEISKQEAMELTEAPLEELCGLADRIREQYCGKAFDLCTIINGKSGRCSENCKYCVSVKLTTSRKGYDIFAMVSLIRS